MAKPFPNHPQLRANFAPINFEAQANDLVVQGELPEGLSGSLYRNGPNPKYAPVGPYHWFGGDGMLHAFHFQNGRVDYLNKWIATPKHTAELAAGRHLVREHQPDPTTGRVAAEHHNGLANTHVIWHGDQLLALDEGSHPFEVDPLTLASQGLRNQLC